MRSKATPPACPTQRNVLGHTSVCGRKQLPPHTPHNATHLVTSRYAVESNSSRILHTTQCTWPRLDMRLKATPPAYSTQRNVLGHVSVCGRKQLLPHTPHNARFLATPRYAVESNSSRIYPTALRTWPRLGMRSKATPPACSTQRNVLGHASVCGRKQLLPHTPHNALLATTTTTRAVASQATIHCERKRKIFSQ